MLSQSLGEVWRHWDGATLIETFPTLHGRYTLTQGNADSQFVWTGAGPDWLPVAGDFTLD
jgi:hypothetical protein